MRAMLPDLARLDLNSCKPCGRGWPARASFAVPYNDWLENPSEVCLICQDPLDNDSTEYPWNHDEGSKVIQLCSNKHVYHVGCAAKTLISQADMRLPATCPECRLPFDRDQETRIRSAILEKYETNPYNVTALEHWAWEEHGISLLVEKVKKLVTDSDFVEFETDDTQNLANLVIAFEFYDAKLISDYLRDAAYLNPTGVAEFAHSLMRVMHDTNNLRDIIGLEWSLSLNDETERIVKTAALAAIYYAEESIRKLIDEDKSKKLGYMLAVSNSIILLSRLYRMTQLGEYTLRFPTQLNWGQLSGSEWYDRFLNWRAQRQRTGASDDARRQDRGDPPPDAQRQRTGASDDARQQDSDDD